MMLVIVRFPSDAGVDVALVEEAVQGCVGRGGSVIGASASSIDVEVVEPSEVRPLMQALSAALRDMGLPDGCHFDIPSSGQRFGIHDF